MSAKECISDMLIDLRNRLPLPGRYCEEVYASIEFCMNHFCTLASPFFNENQRDKWMAKDEFDLLEPDFGRWTTMLMLFFEVSGRFLFQKERLRWEMKRPMKDMLKKCLQIDLHKSSVTELLHSSLEPFDELCYELEELVERNAFMCNGDTILNLKGGRFHGGCASSISSISALRSLAHIADFYYLFHLLRTIYQSEKYLSDLLKSDIHHLQHVVDLFRINVLPVHWGQKNSHPGFLKQNYEWMEVYSRFKILRDNLTFLLARKRGVIPSSFLFRGFTPLGDQPAGHGGFADVWKASPGYLGGQAIALKVLKPFGTDGIRNLDLLKALCKETILWKMTDHPNVLKCMGLCVLNDNRLQSNVALASPWMKNGNLMTYVEAHKDIDRATLLTQVASGLIYLHYINIVHGDLKCANILVSDYGIAQLADFGLSTVGDVGAAIVDGSLSNSAGNPRWLAPELMFPEMFHGSGKSTRESDVYAFAMTALELFTGKVPFFGLAYSCSAVRGRNQSIKTQSARR
ncbi:kinase-like protein [Schizopora paradoxa]|uniref:Kinase-like protein n=1 Tax=Schizopora paradoxa TaxID=27342 RepID=A0A0H2RHS0_9AGAM|nr:kinase-like protein [Schizopora paradoxa]